MTSTVTASEIVHRYNHALEANDFSTARSFLADDLRFEGPIDRFDRADDFIKTISALHTQIVTGVEHQATIAEGEEVGLFYILNTRVANAPVAEWYTVHGGKIVQIRAYFDARPFAHS